MQKEERLRLVTDYLEKLDTKLHSTSITGLLEEISNRIGSVSRPGKMPGPSWSISANHCITGSKLALIPGTICSICYANKGRYRMSPVKNAMDRRLQGWKDDPDWIYLMVIRFILLDAPHVRWFDSGDLQSLKMLQDINRIAHETFPFIQYWLPTREKIIVSQLNDCAPNLTIRISSTKVGSIQATKIADVFTSSVSREKIDGQWMCPSSTQGNKCLDCRACWNKQISNVVYIEH